MASAKMQLVPLAKAAAELNLDVRMLSVDVDQPSILNKIGTPRICFISKINHFDEKRVHGYAMAVLATVARLKAAGTTIILLYCDNLACLKDSRGRLYRDLLFLADHCVVPSRSLLSNAKNYTQPDTSLTLIVDPWQVSEQSYTNLSSNHALRIAWFGNTGNAFYVTRQLGKLMQTITEVNAIELIILSSEKALKKIHTTFHKLLPLAASNWSLQLVKWDDTKQPFQLEQVLGSAHFAWIPSNPNDALKVGVSHNRLVDSVRSGCVPVASEMPSYMEMSKLALLGSDHGKLINMALPQYQRLIDKYQDHRESVLAEFSPKANIASWKSLLSAFLIQN